MENKFADVYGKLGLVGKSENYYRIKLARLVREIEGYRLVKLNREVLAPDFVVFPVPDYDYLKRSQAYTEEDWPKLGEKVVTLRKDCFGWIGIVEAIDKTLKIRVIEKPQLLEQKI